MASFLFGNHSANAAKEIKRDESDTESSSDEESDDLEEGEDAMIDSDSDAENNVNTKRTVHDDEEEDSNSEEESEKSELPADVFGSALLLKKGNQKRKAAWKDEDNEDIHVKDVTVTYKKAVGKHGSKETSIEQYGKFLARKFR